SSTGSGFGILGMRDRARSVGGTVEAGPRADGGFEVEAVLPLGGAGARHVAAGGGPDPGDADDHGTPGTGGGAKGAAGAATGAGAPGPGAPGDHETPGVPAERRAVR
ncbi:two-component sensor histidine kinase, partial [Streptomyces sp. MB09-02B]|nr:two-component sensor histidine kinase [Streptomyces sp. MB09-02B]